MIDVRAGLLSTTLRALRDIGFLESAKRGQITLAVFHILGPSIASLDEIAEIAPFVTDGKYFLVKNFINNTSFFEWDHATYNSYFKKIKDAVDITIPKLNEMAYEQVDLAAVPFVTFIANKGAPERQRPIRSCCAAMCGTGSAMSGRNSTACGCRKSSAPTCSSARPSRKARARARVASQVRSGQA